MHWKRKRRNDSLLIVGMSVLAVSAAGWNGLRANRFRELAVSSGTLVGLGYAPQADLLLEDGTRLTLGETTRRDRRQLVLIGSVGCPHCQASFDAWAILAQTAASAGHEAIVVATDGPYEMRDAMAAEGVPAFVGVVLGNRDRALLGLDVVPQAAVLDSNGRVLSGHVGRLAVDDKGALADLRAALNGARGRDALVTDMGEP